MANQVNNQSIIPSTDITGGDYCTGCSNFNHCQQQLIKDYVHLDDHTQPTYVCVDGLKNH